MLKEDIRQNLVLMVFAGLMYEVLTPATMIFVIGGILAVSFGIKTSKLVRNLLALGVFASYWISYGKIIDPEVGLNFLTSIIVLKILEKDSDRDRYMIFFGLLLLISAGSLFEKTLTYVLFFGVSFMILIRDFYSFLGQKWRLKDLGKAVIWVLPLTFFMFFSVPRLLNPIPLQGGQTGPGEIGYTPDVNISQIESLEGNNSPAFQVLTNRPLNQEALYWRGNTLISNDGWNWNLASIERGEPRRINAFDVHAGELKQTFRLYKRSDYFFALDAPVALSFGKDIFELPQMKTMTQRRWQWIPRYEVISRAERPSETLEHMGQYLSLPLPRKTKSWIQDNFKGADIKELGRNIQRYFYDKGFSYSLSPGKSSSFEEFMQTKKVGLCSHYASAVAIILRANGIPTRLVSGFMGGTYNQFADFYLVTQNDAHVWVEAFENNRWQRLDPTEWIAPDRVKLGGDAFMQSVRNGVYQKNRYVRMPRIFQDMKQWFGQWDFLFYTWLEQVDYYTQDAWLSRYKFKRQWLFSIIPIMLVVFMGLYSWYLYYLKKKEKESDYQVLWREFYQKMHKRGLTLSTTSLIEAEITIRNSQMKDKEKVLGIWPDLIKETFAGPQGPSSELRKRIRNL
ncbi:transglutaminaseTgpA domain-containing protein [Peredibacter sp. HCB2-198]|uniref:transglutaminase family protein n=1 Tax=Peredibacter sp. HCB2-198 TaxID=3383025 RepID=UPI0038B51FBD